MIVRHIIRPLVDLHLKTHSFLFRFPSRTEYDVNCSLINVITLCNVIALGFACTFDHFYFDACFKTAF